jgi:hypothetical protein
VLGFARWCNVTKRSHLRSEAIRRDVVSIDRSLLRSERDTLSIDLEDGRFVSVLIGWYPVSRMAQPRNALIFR